MPFVYGPSTDPDESKIWMKVSTYQLLDPLNGQLIEIQLQSGSNQDSITNALKLDSRIMSIFLMPKCISAKIQVYKLLPKHRPIKRIHLESQKILSKRICFRIPFLKFRTNIAHKDISSELFSRQLGLQAERSRTTHPKLECIFHHTFLANFGF